MYCNIKLVIYWHKKSSQKCNKIFRKRSLFLGYFSVSPCHKKRTIGIYENHTNGLQLVLTKRIIWNDDRFFSCLRLSRNFIKFNRAPIQCDTIKPVGTILKYKFEFSDFSSIWLRESIRLYMRYEILHALVCTHPIIPSNQKL